MILDFQPWWRSFRHFDSLFQADKGKLILGMIELLYDLLVRTTLRETVFNWWNFLFRFLIHKKNLFFTLWFFISPFDSNFHEKILRFTKWPISLSEFSPSDFTKVPSPLWPQLNLTRIRTENYQTGSKSASTCYIAEKCSKTRLRNLLLKCFFFQITRKMIFL